MNRTAAKDSGTKLPQRGRPIRQSWAANCPTCYAASGSPTGAGSIAMSNRDSPGSSSPDFSRENGYPNLTSPDTGYRLLALFRYWNVIEYFYPNRHLTDKQWDEVLPEYIRRFTECGPEGYHAQLAMLITELHDSHACSTQPSSLPKLSFRSMRSLSETG